MIIQDKGDHLVLIRQTDHAVLAGFFAGELGNELFVRPEPADSFRLAATEHDNGWTEWEVLPQIDPVTFSPFSFMSIPTADHISLYQRGIERVVKADRYAGLLVGMHCAGLYDRTRATIPGYSAKYVRAHEASQVNDFTQGLRLEQFRLKSDLRTDPKVKDFVVEDWLQANCKRLEALDRLSLYFCLTPVEPATIDGVPSDYKGSEVDWELRPEASDFVTLEPYPFRRDPLEISLLARKVPKRRYADEAELHKALAQAPFFALTYTIRAGGARMRALVTGA